MHSSSGFLFIKDRTNEESFSVGPLGRWAVGPLLIAGGVLAIVPDAHAGQWQLFMERKGQAKVHDDSVSPDREGQWGEREGFRSDMDTHDFFDARNSASVDNHGVLKGTANWVRNTITTRTSSGYTQTPDPNDNPPEYLIIEIDASVDIDVSNDMYNPGSTDPSKQYAEYQLGQKTDSGNNGFDVSRKICVAVKTNNQETVDIPPTPLSALAQVTGGHNGTGIVKARISANPTISSRLVLISSSVDQSYRKSLTQPPAKPGQSLLAPVPGSDPPVWIEPVPAGEPAHSVAYWNPMDQLWRGTSSYPSVVAGFYGPTYLWTLSGGTRGVNSSSDYELGNPKFEEIELGSSEDKPSVTSSTMTLDVTDGSGTVSADYTINWHLPVGERILKPSTPTHANPALSSIDNFATSNPDPLYGIGVSTNVEQQPLAIHYQALTTTGAYTVSIATAGGASWGLLTLGVVAPEVVASVTALAGAVGYLVVSELPQSNPTIGFENNFLKWQEAVNATRSGDIRITPQELANDPNALNPDPAINTAWRSCSMSVRVIQNLKTTTFLHDLYNSHGFSGQALEYMEKTDGVPVYYGVYRTASQ